MTQVDLYSHDQSYFHFNIGSWHWALTLAKSYGWKPKGTKPTSRTKLYVHKWEDWNGNYYDLKYQLVEESDAHALGEAIYKALRDIPDIHISKNIYLSPLDYWSGLGCKFYLFDFIQFCKKGAFVIA